MNIKETFNDRISERLGDPIFGNFLITFMIWNWRIVIVALGPYKDKIATMQDMLGQWAAWKTPLWITTYLLLLHPFLKIIFFALADLVRVLREKILNSINRKGYVSRARYEDDLYLKDETISSNRDYINKILLEKSEYEKAVKSAARARQIIHEYILIDAKGIDKIVADNLFAKLENLKTIVSEDEIQEKIRYVSGNG